MGNNYKKFERYAFDNGINNGPATRAALRNVYNTHKGSHWHTIVTLFKAVGTIMQHQQFEREMGCAQCIKDQNRKMTGSCAE